MEKRGGDARRERVRMERERGEEELEEGEVGWRAWRGEGEEGEFGVHREWEVESRQTESSRMEPRLAGTHRRHVLIDRLDDLLHRVVQKVHRPSFSRLRSQLLEDLTNPIVAVAHRHILRLHFRRASDLS